MCHQLLADSLVEQEVEAMAEDLQQGPQAMAGYHQQEPRAMAEDLQQEPQAMAGYHQQEPEAMAVYHQQ